MRLPLQQVHWWAVVSLLLVTACVTINVYFPAAAAERAADRIIQDVWGEQPRSENKSSEEPPPQQGRLDIVPMQRTVMLWEGVLDVLVPPVQAAADININTPQINALKNAMAARFKQLAAFFNNGAIGLTRDGLLTVRDLNAVPLKDRNRVKQLVAQDNRDRQALYREIAKANGHPEWEGEIRATFARQWINNARRGWWYQGPNGWTQK